MSKIRIEGGWVPKVVTALTANTTIGAAHYGKVLTNRGAASAITLTLPNPSASLNGAWFEWRGVVAQNVTFKTATADTLIVLGDAQADSLSIQTASQRIGAFATIYCDGTNWFATVTRGTGTVAT